VFDRVAADPAERFEDRAIVQFRGARNEIKNDRDTERKTIGARRARKRLPEWDQQRRRRLQEKVRSQVALPVRFGNGPPQDARDGRSAESDGNGKGVTIDMRVGAHAGEKTGAGKRDRNPVPHQPRVVGCQVIEAGTQRGEDQRDKKQRIAGPGIAKGPLPRA